MKDSLFIYLFNILGQILPEKNKQHTSFNVLRQ